MDFNLHLQGHLAFESLSKKLKARLNSNNHLDFDIVCGSCQDIFLWDWELGFTKIENYFDNYLGCSILSVISDGPTDSRSEIWNFSHIGIHDKKNKTLDFFMVINGEYTIRNWYKKSVYNGI